MDRVSCFFVALGVTLALAAGPATSQPPPARPATPTLTAAQLASPAAIVNGQPINEAAVQRGLKRVPPAEHAKARPEILDYLIDNLLIDQYLIQQKVTVEPKDVGARIGEIQAELKKQGQEYAKMLQDLMLTEEDLRTQVAADLRWERFASGQGTEPVLKALYEQNGDFFDGSQVHARHILLTPGSADVKTVAETVASLQKIKADVEAEASQAIAKVPAAAEPLAKEQERTKALEAAFAKAAEAKSVCPSKRDGGDLGFFPRASSFVEPFAKAAFALKPFQVSDPVQTPFGYHLILVTARKPGQPTKYEEVRDEVKEVFYSRLRETLVGQLRQSAKITVAAAPK
jgi:peptidyl-prolyl cis-trans isomerase C